MRREGNQGGKKSATRAGAFTLSGGFLFVSWNPEFVTRNPNPNPEEEERVRVRVTVRVTVLSVQVCFTEKMGGRFHFFFCGEELLPYQKNPVPAVFLFGPITSPSAHHFPTITLVVCVCICL